jgi:hypothetical protein
LRLPAGLAQSGGQRERITVAGGATEVDGNLVTSREPGAAFVRTLIEVFAGALPRLAAVA